MTEDTFHFSRRFLVGGTALAAVSSLYIAAVGHGALKACNYEAVEPGIPAELQSLIRIGNSYLNEHASDDQSHAQDELLLGGTERSPAALLDLVRQRLLAIEPQARGEFARCETVVCDGWVLAKCEAQLCASIAAQTRRV